MFLIAIADHGAFFRFVPDELLTGAVSEQQERTTGQDRAEDRPASLQAIKIRQLQR